MGWKEEQTKRFNDWIGDCLKPKDKYLDWGSPLMNYALRGAEGGHIILIAGAPNHGKSSLLTSTIINILENNDDVLVLDFTMDDAYSKRVIQYIANLSSIPMNDIALAHASLGPVERQRFNDANKKFKEWLDSNKLVIFEAVADEKDSVVVQASCKFISNTMKEAAKEYKEKKLVVAIDALNDLDLDTGQRVFSDLDREQAVAKELNRAVINTNAIALVTSHVRKNESKRLTLEDLKGNSYLAYCGKAAIGVYNDAKVKRGRSDIMWVDVEKDGTQVAMPILEAHFLKSKTSDFNGVICFQQWPALGRVIEPADQNVQKAFQELVYRSV